MSKWVCPKHPEKVLYVERDEKIKGGIRENITMHFRVSKPAYCDLCDTSYYKYECIEIKNED
jgi:hypothetical protein